MAMSEGGTLGRWTVQLRGGEPVGLDGLHWILGKRGELGEVPVVPCDESAVERAARALHVDDDGFLRRWTARDAAIAVLRAAGEENV